MDLEKDSFNLEELERVCASSEFANKPVMRKLLAYLVTEYVEGRSDRIKGATIAVDVFNRGSKVGQSLQRMRQRLFTDCSHSRFFFECRRQFFPGIAVDCQGVGEFIELPHIISIK